MSLLEFAVCVVARSEQRDPHRLVSRLSEALLTKVQLRKAGLVAGRRRDPLAGALLDERWVVRYWLPDGSATDVIGWIEALDPASVRLTTHDATAHVIEQVHDHRRAPCTRSGRWAAIRGGSPLTICSGTRCRAGWPGTSLSVSGPCEPAGGFTARANSCHAVGDPGSADPAGR